jgi:hypothetical protein
MFDNENLVADVDYKQDGKKDGISWGLEQFDDELRKLISVRQSPDFKESIQSNSELLVMFSERLLAAANRLHDQCIR